MTVDSDACDVRVGYVFLPKQPDECTKPIIFRSGSLSNTRQYYDPTQMECFATVLVRIISTSIFIRNQVRITYRSWLAKMESQNYRQQMSKSKLALSRFQVWIWCGTLIGKKQSRKCAFQTPYIILENNMTESWLISTSNRCAGRECQP